MTSIKINTNRGTIDVDLNIDAAPISCENFLSYIKDGHYNNTLFHRCIPGFMVQGGGMDVDMQQKGTKASITNEADNGLKNTVGSIAMARTGDPHSATSQFFINVSDNVFLDHTGKNPDGWGYCVFAQVTNGMEIVNEISTVPTGTQAGHQNVPNNPIIIESIVTND